jgi:diaminopimelate decarboxylase
MKLNGTMEIKDNNLYIGEINTVELASKYGTPLYVIDEKLVRNNCRRIIKGFCSDNEQNRVAYAGKAFLTVAMCQLIQEEGMYLDVVSGGELYTAYKSGFPLDRIYFHGNNKTYEEINMGVELDVGRFVADNLDEIEKINEIAGKQNKMQRILLRITPGIEAHTHDYIKTGQIDSKFGFTLIEDNALNAVKRAMSLPNIKLIGLHAHIGSQIFELQPYIDEVDIMLSIMNNISIKTGCIMEELNLGGGFGIYYKEGDTPREIEEYTSAIISRGKYKARMLGMKLPRLIIEPGRSIIGNAGTTLYTVGAIKNIPDIRKYVSVDGGMTDNIRPALYNAEYECIVSNKVAGRKSETVTISGKCCESGDILMSDIKLSEIRSGDIIAVLSTGAYGYSMSSNYNKIPKAAVVMVSEGTAKVICRRQTYEDILSLEFPL